MDFREQFGLEPHVEGGAFRELYREGERPAERPAHGVIYYELGRGERSEFHTLDADEYWLWHGGSTLEIWELEGEAGATPGRLRRKWLLGMDEGAEPCALLPAGSIFGARHLGPDDPGTLVSCVTVPEFTYEHYRILSEAEVVARCPEAAAFFA